MEVHVNSVLFLDEKSLTIKHLRVSYIYNVCCLTINMTDANHMEEQISVKTMHQNDGLYQTDVSHHWTEFHTLNTLLSLTHLHLYLLPLPAIK